VPVWSPDGKRLAFLRAARGRGGAFEVWTLELDSGHERRVSGPIEVSTYVERALSWSRNGRLLAVAGAPPSTLVVIAADGSGALSTLRTRPWRRPTSAPGWLPDGRLIISTFVATDDREIVSINPDGSGRRVLTRNRVADFEPSPSPDGREVAFVSLRRGRQLIYVRRANGRETPLAPKLRWQASPAWSPDGREIALDSRGQIYLVTPDGSAQRRLVRGSEPAWSPDATTLAFTGSFGTKFGIWLIGREGHGLRHVGGYRQPSFSPDGRQIAFQQPIADNANAIFLISVDGGAATMLVAPGRNPTWSPDGNTIVFDRRNALWAIGIDGTNLRRLTTNGASTKAPPGNTWRRHEHQPKNPEPVAIMAMLDARSRSLTPPIAERVSLTHAP
jgi:Tol biopolymer transport system component